MAPAHQDDQLHHRPIFPTPPDKSVVAAFKAHVAKTGSPETFVWISMTRPPAEGEVVVLDTFSLDRRKRPRGDMAPCPICSPFHEKYLEDGALIWCSATEAIYAIGPQCAGGLWKDGRVDRAIEKFKAAADVERMHKLLIVRMLDVPAMRLWIEKELSLALAVDDLARSFRQGLPEFCSRLQNDARERDGFLERHESYNDAYGRARLRHVQLGRLAGRSFLRSGEAIAAKLGEIGQRLSKYDGGQDHLDRLKHAAELSATARSQGAGAIREAHQALRFQAELMRAPLLFFAPPNLALIRAWAQGRPRVGLKRFELIGSKLVADVDGERWEADLSGLREPLLVPGDFR